MASAWMAAQLALIATIANGEAGKAATDKAVADLTAELHNDEADAAEQKLVVAALVAQLAATPAPAEPATPETVAALVPDASTDEKAAGENAGA